MRIERDRKEIARGATAESVYLLFQEAVELGTAVIEPSQVRAIDHPDHSVRLLVIVPPVGSEGLLSANVPDVQPETGRKSRMQVRILQKSHTE